MDPKDIEALQEADKCLRRQILFRAKGLTELLQEDPEDNPSWLELYGFNLKGLADSGNARRAITELLADLAQQQPED